LVLTILKNQAECDQFGSNNIKNQAKCDQFDIKNQAECDLKLI